MGFPVILVDSNSGSDTLASGAGPTTALTGSAASTSSDGLTVTLDGSPDLTGVATDGTHVIFLSDSTAGNRNFSKITAKDNTAKTVTVANAFGFSLSGKAWAIGGRRATIAGTTSLKLFENNAVAGDAMPGWAVEMQSGHVETLSSTLNTRRAGDTTSGGIALRGIAGSATRPVLTFSTSGNGIVPRGNMQVFQSFDIKDTSGHALDCFNLGGGVFYITITDIKANDVTSYPQRFAINMNVGDKVSRCAARCAGTAAITVVAAPVLIEFNDIKNTSGKGIDTSAAEPLGLAVIGNLVRDCADVGIKVDLNSSGDNRNIRVCRNTVDNCSGASSDGLQVNNAGANITNLVVEDNILSNNGRYGLHFTSPTVTDAYLAGYGPRVSNNNTYNNTSGAYKSATAGYAYNACPWATGDSGANPTYNNTSLGDYTPMNTSLSGKGFPGGVGGTTGTSISYAYPGAVQPTSVRSPRFRLGIKR